MKAELQTRIEEPMTSAAADRAADRRADPGIPAGTWKAENPRVPATGGYSSSLLARFRKPLLLFVLVLALFGLSALFREHVNLKLLLDFIQEAGPLAPLAFCGILLVAPTIFLPYSLLAIAGGAIFGPVLGTTYTIAASTIGAIVPFIISRKLGRRPLNKILSRSANFDKQFVFFERSVEEKGWKYVAFTRLVTLFPYLVLNYAFGLTKVSLWSYVWATFLFMLPVTVMYSYMGYAGREALSGGEDVAGKMSVAFGCFVGLSCLPAIIGKLRKRG